MDFSFSDLNFNSVETLPGFEARAAFTVNSASVFKEDVDMVPTIIDDTLSYVPWGGDNQVPFDLLALVEKDETLATCQCFNAEVCYGSGLQYCATEASASVKSAVDDFLLDNDLAAYFLGICQDFKHFGFAVSVLILNEDGTKSVPSEKGSLLLPLYGRRKQQARIVAEKQQILDFLTGAENSGKAWLSTFYVTPDGKEQHDVVINKIDDSKEGGDWETDIQEAINMI